MEKNQDTGTENLRNSKMQKSQDMKEEIRITGCKEENKIMEKQNLDIIYKQDYPFDN